MVARVWRATATNQGAVLYERHFQEHVVPSFQRLNGYAGALLLRRAAEPNIELLVVSFWTSLEAIHGFAGDDINQAVIAEEARKVLESYDNTVVHLHLGPSDRIAFGQVAV